MNLLSELRSQRIELWAEGDKIRFRGPVKALTPELRRKMQAHKVELLAALIAADFPPANQQPDDGGWKMPTDLRPAADEIQPDGTYPTFFDGLDIIEDDEVEI